MIQTATKWRITYQLSNGDTHRICVYDNHLNNALTLLTRIELAQYPTEVLSMTIEKVDK